MPAIDDSDPTITSPIAAPVEPHPAPAAARPTRLNAIDLARGIVMVLMVLDNTRTYAFSGTYEHDPTNLAHTTPAIFFTRWITHFCAPAFVFLAGIGIALQRQRGKPLPGLSRFLLTRGLWLIVLEFTVVRVSMQFELDYRFLGVAHELWAIGWGMIAMAGLVRLPVSIVAGIGVLITVLHDLLDRLLGSMSSGPQSHALSPMTKVFLTLFQRVQVELGHPYPVVLIVYAILPWLGVMALGYAVGAVYPWTRRARQRALIWGGAATMAAFVVLRGINIYGDPHPWSLQSAPMFTFLSFINTAKYPPSLDFLCMTLGPTLLALAWFERIRPTAATRPLVTFGRVPLFFYLLHYPLAHGLTIIASLLAHKPVAFLMASYVSDAPVPPNAGFGLGATYLLWLAAILLLFPTCQWYAGFKQSHRSRWLSYL